MFRGLWIQMKCGEDSLQQCCTAAQATGKTSGPQSRVTHHSAEGSTAEEREQEVEGGDLIVESDPVEGGLAESTSFGPDNQGPGCRGERREPGRRQAIKWPKAKEVAVWQHMDVDLCTILDHSLSGNVKAKLNLIGDILHEA